MDKMAEREFLDPEVYDQLYKDKRIEKDCSKTAKKAKNPILK